MGAKTETEMVEGWRAYSGFSSTQIASNDGNPDWNVVVLGCSWSGLVNLNCKRWIVFFVPHSRWPSLSSPSAAALTRQHVIILRLVAIFGPVRLIVWASARLFGIHLAGTWMKIILFKSRRSVIKPNEPGAQLLEPNRTFLVLTFTRPKQNEFFFFFFPLEK